MKEFKDIKDDQIRIIGGDDRGKTPSRRFRIIMLLMLSGCVLLIGGAVFITALRHEKASEAEPEPAYFEPEATPEPIRSEWLGARVDSLARGFTEIRDTLINDIPLRIYIPHNAGMSLHVGRMDRQDSSVIYAAQAADIRADNGGIVGAFVLKGTPRSWGVSKKGFCASIGGVVTVGVAENSPLFEEATEREGYFFRQYPLVDNGTLVENAPRGKSIRRGICHRQGEIFMIETRTPESFHDFAQALVDLGVEQAVYLVGSSAYGWAVDQEGRRHEFGDKNYYTARRRIPENISYIVWKRK
ncbi:hypothetical protein [Alistipes sp.]|uniref:hypothetical protein n=1 Tax=Alistipes sp. TaxID=1872444 RepID=UPI0025BE4D7D|nr:hypothetical protein [Alistipes sp.]